jgi:hypothetical protein
MANITATETGVGIALKKQWTPVTNADTPLETAYFGGEAILEVTGTFNGATVQFQWGSASGTTSDIDTTEHPTGAKFTSAGVCRVGLGQGFLKPVVSGGGGSQSLTITVSYVRQ